MEDFVCENLTVVFVQPQGGKCLVMKFFFLRVRVSFRKTSRVLGVIYLKEEVLVYLFPVTICIYFAGRYFWVNEETSGGFFLWWLVL